MANHKSKVAAALWGSFHTYLALVEGYRHQRSRASRPGSRLALPKASRVIGPG